MAGRIGARNVCHVECLAAVTAFFFCSAVLRGYCEIALAGNIARNIIRANFWLARKMSGERNMRMAV